MQLFILLVSILLLVFLILKKLSPVLALLVVSIASGLALGMNVTQVVSSVNNGIGNTLGGTVMVLVLGAIIGKIAEESGAAQKLVYALTKSFGLKNIQWAILLTGLLAGIPLFYNAGFVVLVPLVFAIAKTTRLPLLYVGLPMVAPLSVTHGFLPPHPGPVALAAIFHASIGKTLLYGLVIAIPLAVIAGILYPRFVVRKKMRDETATFETTGEETLPTTAKSFFIILSPIVLIAIGTAGVYFTAGLTKDVFLFLQEPTIALLLSLGLSVVLLKLNAEKTALYCTEGIKTIALIVLVIAAGGAFKQVLVDSKMGDAIKVYSTNLHLSPLVFGWLIAALFRVALGSATVAALTASGIVVPFLAPAFRRS